MITPTGQNDYIHKIKILGIAPYEGMKTIMQKLAETREDMELVCRRLKRRGDDRQEQSPQ